MKIRSWIFHVGLYGIVFLGASAQSTAPNWYDPPPAGAVPLWSGPAPRSHGSTDADIPEITPLLPAHTSAPSPAVIICPGGGYKHLMFIFEGYNIAKWFRDRGVAAFVLRYRLPGDGYLHPVPMLDAQRALRLVRSRSAQWKLDPKKIGVMGFSAGGHVASTLETHFDSGDPQAPDPIDQVSCRPDFAVLVYAVISLNPSMADPGSKFELLGPNPDPALVQNLSNETQVTSQTPPTILVSTQDDGTVPIANGRAMYAALQRAGVPSALQEYPHGGHGFGGGGPAGWLDKMGDWLKSQGFMP